jgi:hypothetical protein
MRVGVRVGKGGIDLLSAVKRLFELLRQGRGDPLETMQVETTEALSYVRNHRV